MNKKILRIGHRGAKGHVAENTLASIKKALEIGVDGIEIDVHCCKTDELVVFHDFTVDRLTNGTGEISNFTLSELKNLTIEEKFKIPTLAEVLETIDGKCVLNIELKGQNTVKATVQILHEYIGKSNWNTENIIVSSFQHDLLIDLHEIDKQIPLGILTDTNLEEAITTAKQLNAVAIHPDYTMLTNENVSYMQANGFKVYTWTVNEVASISRIKKYSVNGIISDYPERI